MNVGKTRPISPTRKKEKLTAKKLFSRVFARADWLASWFYFGFSNVASVRFAVEGLAVIALVFTVIGVYGEIAQRNVDRGVQVATLFAQIAQTRAIPDGKSSAALATIVEALARERVPMSNLVLSEAEIRVANLKDAYLQAADLSHADFCMTDFSRADLRWTNLSHANLRGTVLEDADFSGADLRKTDLREALVMEPGRTDILIEPILCDAGSRALELLEPGQILYSRSTMAEGARFRRAVLEGAWFTGATLRDADFRGANLRGADLQATNLRGADLRGADLRDAVFCEMSFGQQIPRAVADLRSADLRGAKLCGTRFCDADLHNAVLVGANLSGAELYRAVGLSEVQLASACAARDDPPQLPESIRWLGETCTVSSVGGGNREAHDSIFGEQCPVTVSLGPLDGPGGVARWPAWLWSLAVGVPEALPGAGDR